MKKKSLFILFLAAIFAVSSMAPAALAGGKRDGYYKKHYGMDDKLYKKAHFMLMNSKELGLSQMQEDEIKSMKIEAKKYLIDQDAKIDKIKVDLKAAMWGDDVDLDAVNKLIDKKYELKKEKAKYIANSCAMMKNILDDKQKESLKELWYEKKKKCDKY
jgi:Spy/CpxP family protein refolding chaperone